MPPRVPGRLRARVCRRRRGGAGVGVPLSLPPEERLSESRLVDDLARQNVRARHLPSVDAIVETVAGEARDGDLIVVMSNGGFGGIHRKLLEALAEAALTASPP